MRINNHTRWGVPLFMYTTLLLVRIQLAVPSSDVEFGSDAPCTDEHKSCEEWAIRGECTSNPSYMLESCRKSCLVCDEVTGVAMPCEDKHELCETWAGNGECRSNPPFMLSSCRKSCMVCIEQSGKSDPCTDEHESCGEWADQGECISNPSFMLESCKKSCLACLENIGGQKVLDIGVEQEIPPGDLADKTEAIILRMKHYMENEVMIDPKYKTVRTQCKNQNEKCALWAASGECKKNNFMEINCAPACNTCEKIDIMNRCPLDPDANDAMKQGDLNELFETLTTAEEFAKYTPTVLSRPSHPQGGMGDLGADYQLGPWVVTFENFLTPAECQALIELGWLEGYERSTDTGARNFDGSYGHYKNDGRTSKNTWCQHECYNDPRAKRIMERIENVTGIPESNSEYLQLLKYDVGQYYQQHHDYIPFHVDRQPGVRLLTLFLYLSDVEQGGGTNFPFLNLTVTPKMGRALLWPSVLDSDPNRKDSRTEHQALSVEKGVKYGANAWLHQRDFKGPLKSRCI